MFVKSIKRLIHNAMVRKGALPLGEFFIFPNSSTHLDGAGEFLSSTSCGDTSLISCTYNIYLTNTNLVIQPDVRRMNVRPLRPADLEIPGAKVIACPLGETATLARFQRDIPAKLEEKTLRQWSLFFDLPLRCFNQSCQPASSSSCAYAAGKLPSLVAIRTSCGDNTVLYPSALLFINTASPLAPTAVGGMNGTLAFNQGYTEDLGEKWSRWAWSDQITSIAARNKTLYQQSEPEDAKSKFLSAQTQHVDFWDYGSPRFHTATAILDTLSVAESSNTSSHSVLQKALNEPVGSSPIMVSKCVATPASSGYKIESASSEASDINMTEKSRLEWFQRQSELCVADFAKLHFAYNEEFTCTAAADEEEPELVYDNGIAEEPVDVELPVSASTGDVDVSMPQSMNYMDPSMLLSAAGDAGVVSVDAVDTYPVVSDDNFDFRFGINAVGDIYDASNHWGDNMEDIDNIDFNVTEEDFNFFENEPTKPPSPPQDTFTEGMLAPKIPAEATIPDPQQSQQLMLMDTIQLPDDGTGQGLNFDDLLRSDGILDNELMISANITPPIMGGGVHVSSATNEPTGDNHLMLSPVAPKMSKVAEIASSSATTSPATMVETAAVLRPEESRRLVPPDFAPIKFIDGVNDAKYCDGGKFTYQPHDQSSERSLKAKRDMYRPDYIPQQRKRIKRKESTQKLPPLTPFSSLFNRQQYPNGVQYTPSTAAAAAANTSTTTTTTTTNMIYDNNQYRRTPLSTIKQEDESSPMKDDDRASDISTSSSSDSSSSSSSSNSSFNSDYESESKPPLSEGEWKSAMESAHALIISTYIDLATSTDRKIQIHQPVLDFDSPFSSSTASGAIRPKPLGRTAEDMKILDYLCQQVVMGGYPFTSGLTAVSANGGEIRIGESATALIARQQRLTQQFRGAIIHTPCLTSDYEQTAHFFKGVLNDLFDQTRDASDHLTPLGAIAVRGPLSVQQYYDLSETSQTQSKYGKYQVKKRRPAEPNLDTLLPPEIVVGRQDEHIEASPKLVTFWEKLNLEPYSQRKNVSYFVIFPSNEQIEPACIQFFKGLSTVYESCHLGAHYPGSIGTYRRGLVPVPLLPASVDETWDERQLRSYSAECQNLGSALGGAMVEKMHIVIYLVNPASHLSSYLDMSQCFHKLMIAYHAASMGISTRTIQEKRARLVMQLIPIEHILRPSAFGGYTKFGLRDIAFSVYCKCHTVMGRKRGQKLGSEDHWSAAAMMYTPPFVLAKPILDTIQYTLKPSLNAFPTILETNAMLHLGYCYSFDRKCLILVWTDNQGEMLEYAVVFVNDQPLARVIWDAWMRTQEVSRRTGFEWTFVISKLGLMFEEELQAWVDCLPVDQKIAITCIDMNSALRLGASQLLGGSTGTVASTTSLDYPQTPGSSANTPTPETFSAMPTVSIRGSGVNATTTDVSASIGCMITAAGAITATNDTAMAGETRTLLLNHRVAYSKRRAQVTEGIITGIHDEAADNSWMLPLATGYLIQMSQKPENPTRELFNNEPLIMDVSWQAETCLPRIIYSRDRILGAPRL
ncbi:mediator complex subunit 13 C-terminal-domain-containing protein [Dichotomocladium elegans]|nr:mediator complex subunit 13 C-terminal-domain-containing protein [Dichotomocladium elegans]